MSGDVKRGGVGGRKKHTKQQQNTLAGKSFFFREKSQNKLGMDHQKNILQSIQTKNHFKSGNLLTFEDFLFAEINRIENGFLSI